jgi:myo-inositol-1-phosphate synthase
MQFEQQTANTTDAAPGIGRSETDTHINVNYENRFTMFENGQMRPVVQRKQVKTCKRVPKLGVMLVGLGGNNGSTFTAGIIANRHKMSWATKNGTAHANFFGSFTQCATTHAGFKMNETTGALEDVFMPIKDLLPMVSPCDIDVAGWDISGANLHEALVRAQVLEPTLIS